MATRQRLLKKPIAQRRADRALIDNERALLTNDQQVVAVERQVYADRERYKAVVMKVLEWCSLEPGEDKEAAAQALLGLAKTAVVSEGRPLTVP
jgi:hypothetical protein